MSEKPQVNPSPIGRAEPQTSAPGAEGTKGHESTKTHEFERLKQEAKQAQERYLRTLADFENTKKRLRREREEFIKYAAETVIRELLPIVDSLDQALIAVDKQSDPQAVIKGVHLIYRQLLGLLEKEGVKRIPAIGEVFDPHKHEAVAQIDTTDGTPEETVVEEVQVGYTMYGKVIRPAIVKIAKRTSDQKSEVRSQKSEVRRQRTEDRGQRTEDRSQRSDQESEESGQNAEPGDG